MTRPASATTPVERTTTQGDDARPTDIYRRAAALLISFVVVTATVLGLLLVELHSNARDAGLKLATAFAQLAEEQSVSKIQAIEQTLELAESRLSIVGRGGWRNVLIGLRLERPWLEGLFLLDGDGRIVASSEVTVDAAGRFQSWFEQLRDRLVGGFYVGGLLRDRNRAWVIPATWPIRDAGGQLQGVVMVLVAPRIFERAWQVDARSGYQVELARTDGTVLMRSPLDESAIANDPLTVAAREALAAGARHGAVETGGPDGASRLVIFRRLEEYPGLVASVGVSTDWMLREWRDILQLVVAGWILAVIAVFLFAFWIVRISVARWDAQRRYQLLFQTNPYAILIVETGTGRLLAVNDAAVKQYGFSRDELLAMTVADIAPDGPQAAMSGQFVHRRKDRSLIDVEVSTRPVDFAGNPATMAIAHDVSERVRLETERQATEERLRQSQKMEAIGQLTGGVAHDLNNILTVILANIDGLQEEKAGLPAIVTRRVGRLMGAALQASDLTKQLLAFSRKQPLRPEVTDIGDLVADMSLLLRRSLGENIEIDVRTAADLAAVHVDRSQLETALLNLCVNARDAMPKGGRLLIELENVELEDDYAKRNEIAPGIYVLIAVSDSGIGMTKEVMTRIFEPFFTTKEVGKGTGLGLSMVYGFIKQSKGQVEVYSEPGRGTTFKIFLPAVGANASRDKLAPASDTIPGGKERILVVEDEEQVRETVVEQLASLGYAVDQAADGAQALAMAERQASPFDLMLTDVVMPGSLGGRELALIIRSRWPATGIVFMSGYTHEAAGGHGDALAGTSLLSKPFGKRDLAQMIRRTLDDA